MRKLIIGSSLAIITTFAVLLANADENNLADTSSDAQEITSSQNPGTGGVTSPKEHAMKSDHWKTAKTCTDESGVVHKRGQKGFNTCVEHMRKKEQQMGGTMATHSPAPKSSLDSSTNGSSDTSGSHD